ncbi:MAG: hypothetical protein IRZ00_13485, partial [Gemmatimonadetes bacterium]|nr:hypothetical protein [Gemmatimonadota bacterium]
MPVPKRSRPSQAAMTAAGLRAFFRIAELWRLSAEEQRILLGSPARSTFFKWKRGDVVAVPRDVLERISYVLGIFKALEILLPRAESGPRGVPRAPPPPPAGGRPGRARGGRRPRGA